jgi:hypothetical protein
MSLSSSIPQGTIGIPGPPGDTGGAGADGDSAYEVAVADGFVGTEADWLLSLVGADGVDGADGIDGDDGADGAPGPNTVTVATTTNLTGLLKGDGANVGVASAPTDYVADADSRLTNARTPTSHATSHENGGGDEISVAGLSGVLADPQPPIIGATSTTAVAGNDARLTDARTPLSHTHVPGDVTGTAVVTADSRLSDARTPTAHKTSHQNGGSDEIDVTGLSGVLADPQPPIIGSGATEAVAGNDSRLTNARTPTAHATSHNSGGSDALAIDAAAGTGSLRTLGTSSTSACAGNDARLSDARVPTTVAAAWPVGSVFTSVVSTNPATLLGFGTWAAFATGRVLVGIDAGQTEFDVVKETGGAKTHTLSTAEIPSHAHVQNLPTSQTGSQSSGTRDTSTTGSAADALSTATTGGGGAHNNLQPYIVVYFWERTA